MIKLLSGMLLLAGVAVLRQWVVLPQDITRYMAPHDVGWLAVIAGIATLLIMFVTGGEDGRRFS